MFQQLQALKTKANLNKEYVDRNKPIKSKTVTKTKQLDKSLLDQIPKHPIFLQQIMCSTEIYKHLVSICTSTSYKLKNNAPVVDISLKDVVCNICSHKYVYERKRGDGGNTCPSCGHAPGIDIYEGDPCPNYENVIPQWSLIYESNELSTLEHSMYHLISRVNLSHDQLEYVKHIVRAKTAINDPNPNVVAAAVIYVTNQDIATTNTINPPSLPEQPTHTCKTCKKQWHSNRSAIMCCKYGPSSDSLVPLKRPKV